MSIQSSPPARGDADPPIIWRQRNGKDRNYLSELRMIAEVEIDSKSQTRTLMDIIRWMQQTKQLNEPYHLTESSCQDFARNICLEALKLSFYPNPAKYKDVYPFSEYLPQNHSHSVMFQ